MDLCESTVVQTSLERGSEPPWIQNNWERLFPKSLYTCATGTCLQQRLGPRWALAAQWPWHRVRESPPQQGPIEQRTAPVHLRGLQSDGCRSFNCWYRDVTNIDVISTRPQRRRPGHKTRSAPFAATPRPSGLALTHSSRVKGVRCQSQKPSYCLRSMSWTVRPAGERRAGRNAAVSLPSHEGTEAVSPCAVCATLNPDNAHSVTRGSRAHDLATNQKTKWADGDTKRLDARPVGAR